MLPIKTSIKTLGRSARHAESEYWLYGIIFRFYKFLLNKINLFDDSIKNAIKNSGDLAKEMIVTPGFWTF